MDNNDKLIKKHLKLIRKISLVNLIATSIACSSAPLWLIIRILNNQSDKLLITAILTILAVAYMIYTWCNYYYERKIDKLEHEIDELERNIKKGNSV